MTVLSVSMSRYPSSTPFFSSCSLAAAISSSPSASSCSISFRLSAILASMALISAAMVSRLYISNSTCFSSFSDWDSGSYFIALISVSNFTNCGSFSARDASSSWISFSRPSRFRACSPSISCRCSLVALTYFFSLFNWDSKANIRPGNRSPSSSNLSFSPLASASCCSR